MNSTEIVVIIIDCFSAHRTEQYIKNFQNFTSGCKVKFVIVDNSCNKRNCELLTKGMIRCHNITLKNAKSTYKTPDDKIIVIEAVENKGYAYGNNLGFHVAQMLWNFEYVLFSNNDIIFNTSIELNKLIDQFKSIKEIGILGPCIRGLDGTYQSPYRYVSIYERWWLRQLMWPADRIIPLLKRITQTTSDILSDCENGEVYRVIGAFMLCDAKKFQEVGGFDERTFLYAEEMILSERMKNNGYITFYDKDISITHEGGFTTSSNTSAKKERLKFQSELYYYQSYKYVNRAIIFFTKIIFELYRLKVWLIKNVVRLLGGNV